IEQEIRLYRVSQPPSDCGEPINTGPQVKIWKQGVDNIAFHICAIKHSLDADDPRPRELIVATDLAASNEPAEMAGTPVTGRRPPGIRQVLRARAAPEFAAVVTAGPRIDW